MKPKIRGTAFGHITVEGEKIPHDIVINLEGEIKKRKKKLSKRVYGTSHTISREEIEQVYEKGAAWLIVGTGQFNSVRLSPEAEAYLREQRCDVRLLPTPEAVHAWNEASGKGIALFHVTC